MLKLIFLITILNLTKFFNLGGGIILGEPDEFTHAEIVANFSKSFWPEFSGGPWYYQLPLYPWLGYLASLVSKNPFSALRTVSCFFSLILALAIFFYVRWKISKRAACASALFWTLCPFAIYYSRVGVIEMTVTAFCFLFLFSFDYALETRRKKWALLSGLSLALALLTKYTALIFVFVALTYLMILSFGRTFKSVKKLSDLRTIKLDITPTIPLSITAAVFLPVAFIFYRHDPYLFKIHTLVNLVSWEKFTGARVWVGENRLPPLVWPFVEKMGWWLSWPMVILAMIGIITQVKSQKSKVKSWGVFWISFIIASFFILRRLPFYPRYFLPLVPFIVIFAGIGFEWLVSLVILVSERSERIQNLFLSGFWSRSAPQNDNTGHRLLITPLLLFTISLFIFPSSITAFRATQYNLIEDTGQYIKDHSQPENPWIFSNYWPHFFGRAAGTKKVTWLAESKDEIQAFVPDEERTASKILEEEGGFVVLEELYSKMLISPNKYREEARQWLLKNYEPTEVIPDSSPNFPHSKARENKVEVFVVE